MPRWPSTILFCASLAGCAAGGGCRREATPGARAATAPASAVLTLLATAEVRGTPEPCGCQSDPLGDVARVATLLDEARKKGGALLVDAGGLRYKLDPLPPERLAQAELKAEFLERTYADLGALVGLGDEDLTFGAGKVPRGRRLCSNVTGLETAPPTVREVAGVKVGVFGVIDPAKAKGLAASDPEEAARRAVAALRAQGATVVVGLLHLARPAARKLVRDVPGIDVAVAGDEVGEAGGQPEQVGDAILVTPADEAQRVARVELHVAGGRVSTKLFAGADQRSAELERARRKLEAVGRELDKLTADPTADPSFVATKRAERDRLVAERDRLMAASPAAPSGPYAIAALVPVKRRIGRDETIARAMRELDARVGESNRAAAEKVPPPAAAPGEPRYVGVDECETCHPAAVKLWKGTVHARAWEELVHVDKQWSYDCISCHVTGYGRAGGSAMAHVEDLEAVQCENCHGPGSGHSDSPKKVKLPMPTEKTCKECHTPEHSDTFDYVPYLRDVLGPGHGEKRRARLGPGPTGHDLRHGAVERARTE